MKTQGWLWKMTHDKGKKMVQPDYRNKTSLVFIMTRKHKFNGNTDSHNWVMLKTARSQTGMGTWQVDFNCLIANETERNLSNSQTGHPVLIYSTKLIYSCMIIFLIISCVMSTKHIWCYHFTFVSFYWYQFILKFIINIEYTRSNFALFSFL